MWARQGPESVWTCSHGILRWALLAALAAGSTSDAEVGPVCPRYAAELTDLTGSAALCTTQTLTTTTTSTFTTLPNTTTTQTSSPQRRECRQYCSANGHPWFIKCNWPTCALCLECNTLVIPAQPPDPTPSPGPNSGSDTAPPAPAGPTPTPEPAATPAPAPAPTPVPVPGRRRRTTTTTMTTPAPRCISTCRTSGITWTTLCLWDVCNECDECFPFTSTETSTTTSATLTSTLTTSTFTVTSLTSTSTSTRTSTTRTTRFGETITLTSSTSTTTTSTTSSTVTTTTSTTRTTTTTGVPCSSPSPLLPTTECQQNLTAGDICVARTMETPCVEQSTLMFFCPINHTEHLEPQMLSAIPGIHCKICGMVTASLTDTNPRRGYISSVLRFGPNAVSGEIDESDILGYAAFMVDDCGRTVGDPVAVIPRGPLVFPPCCQYDTYTLPFTAELPVNATSATIAILPNTTQGLLPIGQLTEPIEDLADPNFGVARIGGAVGARGRGGLLAAAMVFGGWLAPSGFEEL